MEHRKQSFINRTKIEKAERVSAKTRKKCEKNNARINEKKEAKNYTQVLRDLKCAYTKKKGLKFRIKQSLKPICKWKTFPAGCK